MQIKVQRMFGRQFDDTEVEIPQFQVMIDDVLVAYIPHAVDSEIIPLPGFPLDKLDEVIVECEKQRKAIDNKDSKVGHPPEYNLRHFEILRRKQEEVRQQFLEEEDDDE